MDENLARLVLWGIGLFTAYKVGKYVYDRL